MKQAAVVNELGSMDGQNCHATEIFSHIVNKEPEVCETRFKIPADWGTGECRRIMINPSMGIGFNQINLLEKAQLVSKSTGHRYRMIFCLGDPMAWEEAYSGTHIQLSAGEGMLCQIEEATEICPYGPNFHYQWMQMMLSPQKMDDILSTLTVNKPIFQSEYSNIKLSRFKLPEEGKRIMQQAKHCSYKGTVKNLYIESKITELLAVSLSVLLETPLNHTNKVNLSRSELESLYQAKTILDNSIGTKINLTTLARLVLLNESKLKKGFRQVFGMPVYRYLMDKRMETALVLLEEEHMPVKDVAERVGYANGSSFSKAFYHKYGFNPSQCSVGSRSYKPDWTD